MRSKQQGQPQIGPAEQLAQNREVIAHLAKSGEARQLMEMLNQQGGVKQAAQSAAAGDMSALVEMVNRLVKTEEGALLVERIEKQAQKAGIN